MMAVCVCPYRGTVEDTELIDGLVFTQKMASAGGPSKISQAKIGLVQFCLSPPKTDVSYLSCSLQQFSSSVSMALLD